jgi:anti-sigma-K factor RskA
VAVPSGASIIVEAEKNELRQYLLGQLQEAHEERLELRLLMDADYAEEFDIIVDEITDQYLVDEFQGEEREGVERYFLKAADRRNKLNFASSLAQYAEVERGDIKLAAAAKPDLPPGSTLFQRARTFWHNHSLALRVATAVAAVAIIVAGVLITRPRTTSPQTFVALTLTMSNDRRGESARAKTVTLPLGAGALRISMRLPDQTTRSSNYRVELVGENGATRTLTITEQDSQEVTVLVPASELRHGSYALRLYAVDAGGAEQRIPGSYFFQIE